jgi:dipeptidyl aminopeptidase/acylaminoacyl peptidase
MKKTLLLSFSLLVFCFTAFAQKKVLDHSVYDGWQSISTKVISNDGKWAVYTISPQEGDGELVIQNLKSLEKITVPRGTNPTISEDSKNVVFLIKPLYKDTRQAKIKKKKPDDMPKDSLGIVELDKRDITKIPRVKSYKMPEKDFGYVAYQLEKPLADTTRKKKEEKKKDDKKKDSFEDAEDDPKAGGSGGEEGTELVVRNLKTDATTSFKYVTDYTLSKKNNQLLFVTTGSKKDSINKAGVYLFDIPKAQTDTLSKRKGGTYKQLTFDETGSQLAYIAEYSKPKALIKFYKLYYFGKGKQDTISILADTLTAGLPAKWTISENGNLTFSQNGKKIFLGTAPVPQPTDTTLVDFELARVDVWNYKDDYLQPMQLKNLDRDLKKSYLASIDLFTRKFTQLADTQIPDVTFTDEGNAAIAMGVTDIGRRVEMQWEGSTLKSAYLIDVNSGNKKLVKADLDGYFNISPQGNYVIWYDLKAKNWFSYNIKTSKEVNLTQNIPVAFYDEENDVPDEPGPYGIMRWLENDKFVFIRDRFDVWQIDPEGVAAPKNITISGRKTKTEFQYVQLDREERFLKPNQVILFQTFNQSTKFAGLATKKLSDIKEPLQLCSGAYSYFFSPVIKAKNAEVYLFQRGNTQKPYDVYLTTDFKTETQLSTINPQQKNYNWLTAELVKWKMYDGKESEGILYKPENFDPTKKYPLILYFYERNSDNLYRYISPAPSASTVNIAFFTSRGYLVFDPNIYYSTGSPGKDAYNSVVSAAEMLAKNSWVDKDNMAIQGQSWGGYQTAYLVTQTNLFKCAMAGAPVANMTSAYGGIRWESGMSRQFQYEHTQSRIGGTLWEKRQNYIDNSPVFQVDKVQTPLLIMHNDADGAVPWYQGIEMFTALRRLGKPVWLLQYNNEAHNLVERRNRKDLSVRMQQFFDYYMKGDKIPVWMEKGVPATQKGKTWGLEVVEQKQ